MCDVNEWLLCCIMFVVIIAMAAEEMQASQKERADLMRQLDIERAENRTEKYTPYIP